MTNFGPLMLDIEGTQLSQQDIECIEHSACGGLILFSRNFQSALQIEELIQSIRAIKPNILIAVDQEGGRVQRFKQDFTLLPALGSLGELFAQDREQAIQRSFQFGELMALEVLSVGCDISFSPVLDLGLEESQIIGNRAFAKEPQTIIELARSFIAGMSKAGMAATGKHFPGHGSVVEDSHIAVPKDERSEKVIHDNDMQPFIALKDDMLAVMPAHIIYSQIDEQPAGFSEVWIKQKLRQEIGFDGVVFSDDLSMKGAEVAGDFNQRADVALEAGCDMILLCNNREQTLKVLEHLQGIDLSMESKARLSKMLAKESTAIGLQSLQETTHWQMLAEKVATID